MEVVVKAAPHLASALRQGSEDATARDARAAVEAYALTLRPMHANRDQGALSRFFVVDAPARLAEAVRARLSQVGGVESVTIAPAPEPPGGPG